MPLTQAKSVWELIGISVGHCLLTNTSISKQIQGPMMPDLYPHCHYTDLESRFASAVS